MGKIITRDRSIIPACDFSSMGQFEQLLMATAHADVVEAYKVGFSLALREGLKTVADMVRDISGKKVIYDHQKAGTDITESTPGKFMDVMAEAGIDGVILFPQAGPATEYELIKAGQDRGLGIIVGGEMTHPRYLSGDFSNTDYTQTFVELGLTDQTGFLRSDAPVWMYIIAARMGVEDFVLPGNKPDKVKFYKDLIVNQGWVENPSIYSPGLVAQGGNLSDGARAAGKSFHAIVGRGIYGAKDMEQATLELGSKL